MVKAASTTRELEHRLAGFKRSPPVAWKITGTDARPNLHGLIRYPAMMVPGMQGDIIDSLLAAVGQPCHIVDPFAGSGTILTEALLRNTDFTGIDINPLAVLICEAKAAIDAGADMEAACDGLVTALRADFDEAVTADFAHRDKWFDTQSCVFLSRLGRAIDKIPDTGSRKVMWTVLAETVRVCSNSRTSTYKLHVRPAKEHGAGDRIEATFGNNLLKALRAIRQYRAALPPRADAATPKAEILFGDTRELALVRNEGKHSILVTSPPYGDNHTTIPYGQFSYLALQWISPRDLPDGCRHLLSSTHTIDTASLGGSRKEALRKAEDIGAVSKEYRKYLNLAATAGKAASGTKVGAFLYEFREALANVRSTLSGPAHWVVTTGNRTAGGIPVPFDTICKEIVCSLGGRPVVSLHRPLPRKRMPTRNSQGNMIAAETTLVAEFH